LAKKRELFSYLMHLGGPRQSSTMPFGMKKN